MKCTCPDFFSFNIPELWIVPEPANGHTRAMCFSQETFFWGFSSSKMPRTSYLDIVKWSTPRYKSEESESSIVNTIWFGRSSFIELLVLAPLDVVVDVILRPYALNHIVLKWRKIHCFNSWVWKSSHFLKFNVKRVDLDPMCKCIAILQ